MIINRIADVFLLIGIVLCLLHYKTLDYLLLFGLYPYMQHVIINVLFLPFYVNQIIALCFVIAAIGKSAQIGLHI